MRNVTYTQFRRAVHSILAGLCAFGGLSPICKGQPSTKLPNILFFYADDLGYAEIGCYGNKEVPTPNIDNIAANGIRFTQGYVSAPLSSPSRAGLMTGRYQTRFGHENNSMAPEGGLPLSETTLGSRMKELGYATGIIGKWHLGSELNYLPIKRGFDDYYGVFANPGSYFQPRGFMDSRVSLEEQKVTDQDFYTTDAFAARAVQWIDQHKDKPWFLYLPFNAVHVPYNASEKYLARFKHISDPRKLIFDAMLSAMDDAVGLVLAKVRALGQEENTLIFFISDNGAPIKQREGGNFPLRGGKLTAWEGGIRLPYMIQWKNKLPAGIVYEYPVIQLDVMPTCIAAAGGNIDPAWKLDGVNLLPYLTGMNKSRPHQTLYWRLNGMWAIRNGDIKLVHGQPGAESAELFDLSKDMSEKNNLVSDKSEQTKELKALWDKWNAEQAPLSDTRGSGDEDIPKKNIIKKQ